MIQIFKPAYDEREEQAVLEVLRSGWIGLGPKTAEFEERFAEYVGARFAIATNSATSALHLALVEAGVGEGDEVLVPAITFVSTAHAVRYTGATPVFVDVEPDTLCMNIEDARKRLTSHTRGIIPVHYSGHACEMVSLKELVKKQKQGIVIIEDAAHACGSFYFDEAIGSCSHSDFTCFSFHAVKNLATADGGMIATNNSKVASRLKVLRWCGIDKSTFDRTESIEVGARSSYGAYGWYYEVKELGYKYHMNDIAAAIGLVQLDKLPVMNARRREIVSQYQEAFANLDWLEIPVEKSYCKSSWHIYHVKLATPEMRDALNVFARMKGVATGVHYMPVHFHPYYFDAERIPLLVAEEVWRRILTLPLYPDMTQDDIERVIDTIIDFGKTL